MGTATFIKQCDGFRGEARLYRVDPPAEYQDDDDGATTTDYVIVSAVNAFGAGMKSFIFPADEDGKILDWLELVGSFQGGADHVRALAGAEYEISA